MPHFLHRELTQICAETVLREKGNADTAAMTTREFTILNSMIHGRILNRRHFEFWALWVDRESRRAKALSK